MILVLRLKEIMNRVFSVRIGMMLVGLIIFIHLKSQQLQYVLKVL